MERERWAQHQRRCIRRPGFTVVELVVVLIIAGILGSVAVPQFNRYRDRRAVTNARDAFGSMAARARAAAIERGDVVRLVVDPATDEVRVDTVVGAPPLDRLDLASGELRANLITGSITTICYTPRGYAQPGCSSALPVAVRFAVGRDTLGSRITPIGRVERQ